MPHRGAGDLHLVEDEGTPQQLLRPVWWLAAQDHAKRWDGTAEARTLAVRVAAEVDQMWALIDEVEHVSGTAMDQKLVRQLLGFLKQNVVGSFFDLAREISRVMSHAPDGRIRAFDSAVDHFSRSLDMARMASSDPVVPSSLRTVITRAYRRLSESLPDLAALVGAFVAVTRHGSRHP